MEWISRQGNRVAAPKSPVEAIVFRGIFAIDRVWGLWQPLCCTPLWGLLVVNQQKQRIPGVVKIRQDKVEFPD
jgi:hypothetical protein